MKTRVCHINKYGKMDYDETSVTNDIVSDIGGMVCKPELSDGFCITYESTAFNPMNIQIHANGELVEDFDELTVFDLERLIPKLIIRFCAPQLAEEVTDVDFNDGGLVYCGTATINGETFDTEYDSISTVPFEVQAACDYLFAHASENHLGALKYDLKKFYEKCKKPAFDQYHNLVYRHWGDNALERAKKEKYCDEAFQYVSTISMFELEVIDDDLCDTIRDIFHRYIEAFDRGHDDCLVDVYQYYGELVLYPTYNGTDDPPEFVCVPEYLTEKILKRCFLTKFDDSISGSV